MYKSWIVALFGAALSMVISFSAAGQVVDSIHFLIPGGAGGGWDGTARGTGEALTKSGLVGKASYEICQVAVEARQSVPDRKCRKQPRNDDGQLDSDCNSFTYGSFPHNFRDLTLVAGRLAIMLR